MKIVLAQYSVYSEFELPGGLDIEESYDYWVKWDTLYVTWKEGERPKSYEPKAFDQYDCKKRPEAVWLEES